MKKMLILVLGILFAWIIIFFFQYPFNFKKLLYYDSIQKADLIVFISGASERSVYALELLKKGYAKKLFSPGGEPKEHLEKIQAEFDSLDDQELNFDYYVESNSTFEDAVNTRKYIRDNPSIKSILLVTSPYHSYRARWIFKKVMPNIEIINATVPVEKSNYNIDQLHDKKSGSYLLARKEQLKFIGYYLMYSWRNFGKVKS